MKGLFSMVGKLPGSHSPASSRRPAWTKTVIADLSDAEARITQAAGTVAAHVAECEAGFNSAANGDFASLRCLSRSSAASAG